MNTRNLMLPAIIVACAATPAHAQTEGAFAPDEDVILSTSTFEIVHVSPELSEILEKGRPAEPQTVSKPKFAIRTADNKFVLSIGGVINPILGYDIGNDLYNADGGGIDFTTGAIPVPAQPGKKGAFFINPLQSYFDFTIVGLGGTDNQITGYIKIGTNGSKNNALLKRAYINWRGITFGETATLLQDGDAVQPPTIDPEGPCGDVGGTAYALSYKSPSFNGFSFAAGLEVPTFYSSNGVYRGKDYSHDFFNVKVTDEVNQLIPDIPVWIQYEGSENNRIRLSGILRNFAYRDLIADRTRHIAGWGAQLSGNFSFYKPLVFNFQAIYGKGIANYIQDISGRQISFTPKDDHVGEMESNPMMGLVFGASYNATKRLQFNVVGSYARVWNVGEYATLGDDNGVASDNNYRHAVYVAANCFYTISSYLQWGIEYDFGRRSTYDLGSANDNRVQTQLIFSF